MNPTNAICLDDRYLRSAIVRDELAKDEVSSKALGCMTELMPSSTSSALGVSTIVLC